MIVTVVGGRDRHPSLAEIERVVGELRPGAVLRCSTAYAPGKQGTERIILRYVKARGLAEVEPWPTRAAAMAGDLIRAPADMLIALDGGESTRSTIRAARKRGVPVIEIEPVTEPRIWNRHHGTPPGPSVYIGRGTPLGNPFEIPHGEHRAEAAPRILGEYRRWLWSKIAIGSPDLDMCVIEALRALTPETFVECSCWPLHCHGEHAIRAHRLVAAGDPRIG